MAVLTSTKRKNLKKFVSFLGETINDLIRDAPTAEERKLYEGLRKSVQNTGIYFHKTSALAERGFSRLMGLHETHYAIQYVTDKKGHKVGIGSVKAQNVIYMPAKHLFKGNKLTLDGVGTLIHEWSHFPKDIRPVAKGLNMPREAAEELIADVMAAKVLKKMGRFTDAQVLRTFRGRVPLFRKFKSIDYMGSLARAITPKGEKPKVILPMRRRPRKRKPLFRRPLPKGVRRRPRVA